MRCIVTAGPTAEPLDRVRRLTNFSTGRLGSELAEFLVARGHKVTLLKSSQATFHEQPESHPVESFSTTAELGKALEHLSSPSVHAVFHAAAVSDFSFGRILRRSPGGDLVEVKSAKFSTREGILLAELVPAPKLIARLRDWFPNARLVGWKYEVDADRAAVLSFAERQLTECRTDACVANGPAYGPGFGLVTAPGACQHLRNSPALFAALLQLVPDQDPAAG